MARAKPPMPRKTDELLELILTELESIHAQLIGFRSEALQKKPTPA